MVSNNSSSSAEHVLENGDRGDNADTDSPPVDHPSQFLLPQVTVNNNRKILSDPNGTVTMSPSSNSPFTNTAGGPHVPFSGLSLSSTSNGATYQHTVGGYDTTATGPVVRIRNSRFRTRKLRKRIVFKNGDVNVVQEKLSKRHRRYLADIVTTLVDIKWRWTLLVFSMSFVLSWLMFALIWWLIMVAHGDFETNHGNTTSRKACVENVKDLTGCFLFSLESQHTIGYGFRYINDHCPDAIVLLCVQSIVGLVIQALMVSVVFTKLARPKKRAQTLMFSKNAVICQRDGKLCLMFRVGNMRTSSLVDANVRAHIIRKRVSLEGETIQFDMEELNLGKSDIGQSILFIWPLNIFHTIDEDSPLYNMSAEDLLHRERFEIVVVLEGSTESTAMTTQARSSYTPGEILWGHRMESVINFRKESGEYWVDYSKFNSTYEVDTPLCSAFELQAFRKNQEESLHSSATTNTVLNNAHSMDNFQLLRRQGENNVKISPP